MGVRRRFGREGYEASKGILMRKSNGGRDEIFKEEEEDGRLIRGTKKFKHLQVIRHPDLTRFDSLYSATSRGRGRETSCDELQEVPGERQGESTPPSCVNFRLQYSYPRPSAQARASRNLDVAHVFSKKSSPTFLLSLFEDEIDDIVVPRKDSFVHHFVSIPSFQKERTETR